MENEIDSFEDKLQEAEEDTNQIPPSDLFAFNEQRSCSDLVRMCREDYLDIGPDFQRGEVWTNPRQTMFIDSLSKQLPIPSMCISLDYKTQERLVVDGLQRISTIIQFLTDKDWRLSKLEVIRPEISGKTPKEIREKYPTIYSTIENLTLPITVLRCDGENPDHMNYLFMIFHRLNVGGVKLNNQEIRNCIYSGPFNTMIKDLVAKDEKLRKLLSIQKDKTYRFYHEEIVLRFFAFNDGYERYSGPPTRYLNEYMNKNRSMEDEEREIKEASLTKITSFLHDKTKGHPLSDFLGKPSKAILEGVFIGVARNWESLQSMSSERIQQCLKQLAGDEHFSTEKLEAGAYKKERVIERLDKAVKIFSGNND